MSALPVILACSALSVIAAAGVLRPFGASDTPSEDPAALARMPEPRTAPPRVVRNAAPAGVAAIALLAVTIPFLLGAFRAPAPSAQHVGVSSAETALTEMRRRVDSHPGDVASRLDLAAAYLGAGHASAASDQYVQVLRLDPDNVVAHARLGWILMGAGRPRIALYEVDRALAAEPHDPEALFVRGLIFLRGLDRPGPAVASFRAYLRVAPFGAQRAQASQLLGKARAELRRT